MKHRILALSVVIVISALNLSVAERGLQIMPIKTQTGEEVGLYKGSYALIIGASDYTAGWPKLPGVKKDVAAVKTALEEHGFQVEVAENPTRVQLDQAFTGFINQYGQDPENRLVIYFSGHGHTLKLAYGDEMGYIVPVEAPNPFQDQAGFIATAMDMQMLEVYAKRIQAKHAIFLFDSCFSGSIFSLSRAVPESISYKTAQPVRQFLTSGSAEEQVPDESIFRQQFVAALQGEADVNGDGYVTGTELGEFLQDKVVNYSKGSQHPQYGKIRHPSLDKGDFVFQVNVTITAPPAAGTEPKQGETSVRTADPETEAWELIKDSDNMLDVQDFLEVFPDGKFAKVAQLKLKQLERQSQAQPPPEPPQAGKEKSASGQEGDTLAEGLKQLEQERGADVAMPEPEPEPKDEATSTERNMALKQVHDDLFRLRDELLTMVEKRDAAGFQKTADALTETTIQDIEAALKTLRPALRYARGIVKLQTLRSGLPLRLRRFIRLAKAGRWEMLRIDVERSFRELGQSIDKDALTPDESQPASEQTRRPLLSRRTK